MVDTFPVATALKTSVLNLGRRTNPDLPDFCPDADFNKKVAVKMCDDLCSKDAKGRSDYPISHCEETNNTVNITGGEEDVFTVCHLDRDDDRRIGYNYNMGVSAFTYIGTMPEDGTDSNADGDSCQYINSNGDPVWPAIRNRIGRMKNELRMRRFFQSQMSESPCNNASDPSLAGEQSFFSSLSTTVISNLSRDEINVVGSYVTPVSADLVRRVNSGYYHKNTTLQGQDRLHIFTDLKEQLVNFVELFPNRISAFADEDNGAPRTIAIPFENEEDSTIEVIKRTTTSNNLKVIGALPSFDKFCYYNTICHVNNRYDNLANIVDSCYAWSQFTSQVTFYEVCLEQDTEPYSDIDRFGGCICLQLFHIALDFHDSWLIGPLRRSQCAYVEATQKMYLQCVKNLFDRTVEANGDPLMETDDILKAYSKHLEKGGGLNLGDLKSHEFLTAVGLAGGLYDIRHLLRVHFHEGNKATAFLEAQGVMSSSHRKMLMRVLTAALDGRFPPVFWENVVCEFWRHCRRIASSNTLVVHWFDTYIEGTEVPYVDGAVEALDEALNGSPDEVERVCQVIFVSTDGTNTNRVGQRYSKANPIKLFPSRQPKTFAWYRDDLANCPAKFNDLIIPKKPEGDVNINAGFDSAIQETEKNMSPRKMAILERKRQQLLSTRKRNQGQRGE